MIMQVYLLHSPSTLANTRLHGIASRPVILNPLSEEKMKRSILAVFISVAWTLPAYAEVMDKEPSVPMIWGAATVCSLLGFIAAKFKPALVVGTGALAALYFGGVIAEIKDQTIGKAIIEEAGKSYPIHAYFAVAIVFMAHATGLALRKFQKSKANR